MLRKTFYDFRTSRAAQVAGFCNANLPELLALVNEAQEKLKLAGGEVGWWGSWAKVVFTVIPGTSPYITAPSDIARIINLDVCRRPIRMQNEFWEFLEYGVGLQNEDPTCRNSCSRMQAFDRGQYPTPIDITPGVKLRAYASNPADVGKRLYVDATDTNGNQIYVLDNGFTTRAFPMTLVNPFVDSTYAINTLARIQKEVTLGTVSLYEVNQTTGAQTLLATFAPSESNPAYRRYFLSNLPNNCCDCGSVVTPGVIQVTAMCKLELVPATCDSDPLLIQNLVALKEEVQAIRYSEVDSESAKKMETYHHRRAVKYLNDEIVHYTGKEEISINVAPWGRNTLERMRIGPMM